MLSLPLVLTALLPQGPGSLTATVNDPSSHGVVGDALLSLNEAIRVANGSLATSALSAAELARFSGTGTLLENILIDAAVTPTITLQAPLADVTVIPGPHYHVHVIGIAAPGVPRPVIVGGSQPRVFTLRTYNVMLHGLRIDGGQVAVDALMPQPPAPAVHMAEVMECTLTAQTTAAIRLHGTGTDESMVMVTGCELSNMPLGFLLEDQTAGGMVMLEAERVHMDGVALGSRVVETGAGGNMSMLNVFRSTFVNGATFAEQRRPSGGAQQFMFRIVHCDVTCTGNVLDIEGSATGLTMVHHHHSDFVAGAGQKAFWVWPRTAEFDVHGSEMDFTGDVSITGNLTSPRFWQQNNTYRNGLVTLDIDGALPNLLWNHYENCTIDVPASARSPVAIRQSQLVATSVASATFLAPVTLQNCWRAGGTLSGFASEQTPAPAAFLGTTTITPAEPQVGTSLQLSASLPAGIALIWDIALAYPRPNTTQEPVRFYGDPATLVVLPAVVIFQSTITIPIPNIAALAGLEFYAQGISLPLSAQPWIPPYHLPRGSPVWLRP